MVDLLSPWVTPTLGELKQERDELEADLISMQTTYRVILHSAKEHVFQQRKQDEYSSADTTVIVSPIDVSAEEAIDWLREKLTHQHHHYRLILHTTVRPERRRRPLTHNEYSSATTTDTTFLYGVSNDNALDWLKGNQDKKQTKEMLRKGIERRLEDLDHRAKEIGCTSSIQKQSLHPVSNQRPSSSE
jgi:hypothetical protein